LHSVDAVDDHNDILIKIIL